ncbi:aromatic prenyl transferase, partial [Metarhizium majus ARSEF 297]
MADQTRPVTSLDLGFWMRHSISPLIALLRAAGYSAADQGEHIRILCEHVLPNIGPRPTATHPIKARLQTAVRRSSLASIFALESRRRWSDRLLEAFTPTAEEAKRSQENLQKWIASLLPPALETKPVSRLPFAAFAFDLDGPRALPKLYVNPKVKEIGSGSSTNETIWNLLRNLEPPINSKAVDAISE